MSSRNSSFTELNEVKVTMEKITVLYDTDGKAIAMNVTSRIWIAGQPSAASEFTLRVTDPDMKSFGKALSDLVLGKIKTDHESST
jgi:hypothetical protein